MMRIAICMSGLTRTFKYCYKSLLDNVIGNNEYDVFTIVSDDENNEDLNLIPMVKKLCVKKSDMPEFIENKYKKGWRQRGSMLRYTAAGLLEQYWKLEECFKLAEDHSKENNIKYDWVIRCRPDLFYHDKMSLSVDKLDSSILYTAPMMWNNTTIRYYKHNKYYFDENYINDYHDSIPDQFAISNMELMKIYCTKYSKLDEFSKNGGILSPEHNVRDFLKMGNVKVKYLRPFFIILRPDGYNKYLTKYPSCEVNNYNLPDNIGMINRNRCFLKMKLE